MNAPFNYNIIFNQLSEEEQNFITDNDYQIQTKIVENEGYNTKQCELTIDLINPAFKSVIEVTKKSHEAVFYQEKELIGKIIESFRKRLQKLIDTQQSPSIQTEPYAWFQHRIKQITDTYFVNNNAKPLSPRATFQGFDVGLYQNDGFDDEIKITINKHNAANVYMEFKPLEEFPRVSVNAHMIDMHSDEQRKAYFEVLQAIQDYIDIDISVRREEFRPKFKN